MAERKFVSYLRVSTDKQGKSGLGIEAQRQAVERYLNGGRWTVAAEYVETESGRRSDRPKLAAAVCTENLSSGVVVVKSAKDEL
jgi:DNA invertase Pin-like site-specific DNA recombinase